MGQKTVNVCLGGMFMSPSWRQRFSGISERDRRSRGRWAALLVSGIALTLLTLAVYLAQPELLLQLDRKWYDLYLKRTAHGDPVDGVVVLDIDESSLTRYGQWPWPRYRLALLMGRLAEAGASVMALDILLAEPDRTSPVLLGEALRQELGVNIRFEGLPSQLEDNDALLASVLRDIPAVLGCYFRFDRRESGFQQEMPPGPGIAERRRAGSPPVWARMPATSGVTLPLPVLSRAAPIGFFNMEIDADGLVRRAPLVLRAGEQVYASLALQALMVALGTKTLRLETGEDGLETIGIGPYRIRVAPDGSMALPYRGPGRTFPYLTAESILEGTFEPEQVRGKVVFVGTSAPGLRDIRSTPLDPYYPGVEVHATIVDAVLSNRQIVVPPWTPGLQILLMLFTGCVCTALFIWVRPIGSILAGLSLWIGLYQMGALLFDRGLFLSPLWISLTVIVVGGGIILFRFWWAERDKRLLRRVFSRYVSPEVVTRIVERGEGVLRGEEREVTVMFTDLRQFTTLSETLKPEDVVSLLNRYFTPMTILVRESEGTLDKFIGDALMAFWNAPLDIPDHPARAVRTILAMLEQLETLNSSLEADYGILLRMGAGLHTGSAYVGNMGSQELTSYTAIGDTVNLASRLEGLCSRFGVNTVLSETVALRCDPETALHRLVKLRVKGRAEPVTIFTALTPAEAERHAEEFSRYAETRDFYEKAVALHEKTQLRKAIGRFETLARMFPQRMLYHEYIAHGRELCRIPDGDPWDDVWTLTGK